jgi:hypothetical protein
MRTTALIAVICGVCVVQTFASHSVSSYTRRDGTFVSAHAAKDPGEASWSHGAVYGFNAVFIFGAVALVGLGIWAALSTFADGLEVNPTRS